jgi:hypothetical protein
MEFKCGTLKLLTKIFEFDDSTIFRCYCQCLYSLDFNLLFIFLVPNIILDKNTSDMLNYVFH